MPTWLRHALRSLRRTPAFTAAATLTLVLGIGSVAAAAAIVYGVVLQPLRYGHPDRLVNVGLDLRDGEQRRILQPPGVYFTYKRFARRIDDVGFYRTGNANIWTDNGTDEPERVTATWVTSSLLPLLQVRPLLGRTFTPDEDIPRGPNVVVLSARVWQQRFHGARDVVGKTLIVNAVARVVVGVMPDGFMFPASDTRLWLPARLDPSGATGAGDFTYTGVARLAPGATPEDAQRDFANVLPKIAELFPQLESGTPTSAWLADARPTPAVRSLRDEMTSGVARTLWMIAAASALVLLVAWANVANLMLIRADGRQLELAVREALGARRLRIASSFLGESLVLALAAGVIGSFAAWGAVRALVAFGPADVPRLTELGIGAPTIVFVVVVSVLGAIVCGAVPTFRLRRTTLSINLRDGARGDTASKARQRLRATIAAVQIAVALVVSVGSALLLRTFDRLYQERPGFDATNVVTLWTQLPFARYGDSASVVYYARMLDAVRAVPGVRGAGLTTHLPLGTGETRQQSFRADDGRTQSFPTFVIDDGYFATMRIPVVAGRVFDRLGLQRDGNVVISQRAARTLWDDPTGATSVGRQLTLTPSGPTYTVVGVVGDVRDQELGTAPSPTLYVPQAVPLSGTSEPSARRTMALVVRTAGPTSSVLPAIRRVVRDLDPTVPIFNVESMDDVVRASTARLSLTLALMSAAAAITLILGTIGLYGVMAYMVALQTRELGVRVALGADPMGLARSVAMRGLRLVGVGIVAGFVLYALAAPFLRAFLYGVTTTDPLTLAVATLALLLTGALAAWLAARRAARVDPAVALRAE